MWNERVPPTDDFPRAPRVFTFLWRPQLHGDAQFYGCSALFFLGRLDFSLGHGTGIGSLISPPPLHFSRFDLFITYRG
jgi:hypothetical protein